MAEEKKQVTSIALFQERTVRRAWYNEEWYFSVIDVIAILTDSENANRYWSDLKRKLVSEGYDQVYENIVRLKLVAPDKRMRETDCSNTRTLLRIIQSVSSPKADPLKRWLAEVGTQRIEEIENPELAMTRVREIYEQKGYPQEWIEKRMRGIAIRNELTTEWEKRGAEEGREYAILTNEIARATFDVGIQDHKLKKSLKTKHNLRDHYTDLEQILSMLGEATATAIHRERDTQGFNKLQVDARDAGNVAGRTRKDIERQTGKPVVSETNYLELEGESKKKTKRIKKASADDKKDQAE
jgi:DNA-damage-inducible protein D